MPHPFTSHPSLLKMVTSELINNVFYSDRVHIHCHNRNQHSADQNSPHFAKISTKLGVGSNMAAFPRAV